MGINLSIKGVSEEVAERLRARAERHHRSLQGELMAIIESAAAAVGSEPVALAAPAAYAKPVAPALRGGWKSIDDLVAERRLFGTPPTKGVPMAVDIVRADRDSR